VCVCGCVHTPQAHAYGTYYTSHVCTRGTARPRVYAYTYTHTQTHTYMCVYTPQARTNGAYPNTMSVPGTATHVYIYVQKHTHTHNRQIHTHTYGTYYIITLMCVYTPQTHTCCKYDIRMYVPGEARPLVCTCIYTHALRHTHVCTRDSKTTRMCVYICTDIYINICIYICILIYIYIYIQIRI